MEEYISISDAFIVTIFSMAAVFIVLVMISSLINGLKMIGNREDKIDKGKKVESKQQPEFKEKAVENGESEDVIEEELVAVIAAAVAANLGLNIPDIRIRSIRRVPQNSSPWIVAGRGQATGNR